jgi:hypothetical protein
MRTKPLVALSVADCLLIPPIAWPIIRRRACLAETWRLSLRRARCCLRWVMPVMMSWRCAAFTGHKAVQRVHRVVQLPGHRSIRAAARALGIGDNIINSQLKAVERAVGFQIINRAIPLSVTARGQAFIHNAEQVLQQLDDVLPEGLLKIT